MIYVIFVMLDLPCKALFHAFQVIDTRRPFFLGVRFHGDQLRSDNDCRAIVKRMYASGWVELVRRGECRKGNRDERTAKRHLAAYLFLLAIGVALMILFPAITDFLLGLLMIQRFSGFENV